MSSFVDRTVVHVTAGSGGHGCASVHREKFKPLGGPDGGNGGNGGEVVLVVDQQTTTLLDFHRHPHQVAGNGKIGMGGNRDGANGADRLLPVPDGTVVIDATTGAQLIDLVGVGTRYVVAQGGRGGLGNAALASPRRKAPGFALLGESGETRDIVLELKTVADVALVGFPNAGKSSLVAALSAARPKIADYPFTTLVPNLGVVQAGETVYTVADVPGLIPGASDGKGLGLEFLRHVERCSVLVHVVDCANLESDRNPVRDLETIEHELSEYGGLADRPRLVALNKIDVPDAREMAEIVRDEVAARGWPVYEISAASREGLRELSYAMARAVVEARAALPLAEPTRIVLRPKAVDDVGFTIERTGEQAFLVRGGKPERWVQQTDFTNDEAVGYLGDRLARLGVEKGLAEVGAEPGADVTIGDVSFDWAPTTMAGVEVHFGLRGTDPRFEMTDRVGAPVRRLAKDERRRRADEDDVVLDALVDDE